MSKLKTTFPRQGKKDAGNLTVLVEEGARLGVEAKAIQTAYDRGHAAWPGYEKTPVKREAWAAGRAAHLIKAAADPTVMSNDRDLLTGVQS